MISCNEDGDIMFFKSRLRSIEHHLFGCCCFLNEFRKLNKGTDDSGGNRAVYDTVQHKIAFCEHNFNIRCTKENLVIN